MESQHPNVDGDMLQQRVMKLLWGCLKAVLVDNGESYLPPDTPYLAAKGINSLRANSSAVFRNSSWSPESPVLNRTTGAPDCFCIFRPELSHINDNLESMAPTCQ